MQKIAKRETWSSHWIFILACIGSAVGLGNIWRFPYITGLHGGGSFILLYILAVLLIGIPLLLVELSVGKTLRTSAVGAFKKMLKKYWWFVLFPLGLALTVLSYYLVVMGWTLTYTFMALGNNYIPFTEAAQTWWLAIGAVVALILVQIVSRVNIKAGLEKINLYMFPVFLGALILIFVNSFSLEGYPQAIQYLTTIEMSQVLEPINMLNAISQAVFSISIGMVIMLTYGSYMGKKEEIFHSSLAIAGADALIALAGALIVFSVTFTYGISPAAGPELAFESLPYAFLSMPYGAAIMFLFFLLLFSAAMTSAVALSEVLVDNAKVPFGGSRAKGSLLTLGLILILFIPSALSFSPVDLSVAGIPFLEFLDANVIGQFTPLVIVVSLIAFTWFYKDCKKALAKHIPAPLVIPVYLMTKYVAPALILVLQGAQLLHDFF